MRLTYSQRTGSSTLILGLLGLALVEVALIGGLISVLVPSPLRWVLLAALAALTLWAMLSALSPFVTAHHLDAETLQLRFGLAVRAKLPRAQIATATLVSVPSGVMAGATYTPERRELRLGLHTQGLIQLELAEPLSIRVGLRGGGSVERIILALDEPELLLTALTGSAPAAPTTEITQPMAVAVGPGPTGMPLLVADGLARCYGQRSIVAGLSFAVRAGEIYGFLGPNGAGKTTTIKLLVGLLTPDAGRVSIAGHDVWKAPLAARAALGYVADRALLTERLTGREYLYFLAQLRALPLPEAQARSAALLDQFELGPHADCLSGSYSLGMRRKLALAGALLHRPPVLVLDEPFNGLDPRAAYRLKLLLRDLADAGSAILLSTHDLAAMELVADRVGLLHAGRLVAEGRPDEVRSLAAAESLEQAFLQLTVTP
ncbi:ABC transporter ATP-binding protein [Candidatus Chloroploca sp. M-50]|uniref:ABC transporter ATP-binding protein n=1 Tax=Candidatus Chloroploca mongolica TaxID=2528176 RepID=A0ABS4DA27_9CHLR|nr:ABC transporter ATP-binding protein [Candidatus Chloroploca mongolica]MBP1466282.1 ABC transporter ATP-binding protein [Candidatus Chloroploca mongolica]